MKDRLTLAFLIIALWCFLIAFQMNTTFAWSIVILIAFMSVYSLYMQAMSFYVTKKHKKKVLTEDYIPFVTIFIPAHNEGNVLKGTVDNILTLDYDGYEIILIDDRSDDNTAEVIREIQTNHPDIKSLIREKNSIAGKSAALNEAMLLAKGEVFCIFDADARVKKNFLRDIIPYLNEPSVGAVQARKVVLNKDYNFLTRWQNNEYTLDSHFQVGRNSIKGAVEIRGNGQLIKREAVEDINGWNNDTITDDLDMTTRLHLHGWDIRFCPHVEVYEEAVTSFIPLLKQRRRWVEGSIRRYLDHFFEVILSKKTSKRTRFDMFAYIAEFVMPVWLISEWAINAFLYIKDPTIFRMYSSIIIISALFLFFLLGLIYSLRKYDKLGFYRATMEAIETGLFFLAVWTPVVLFIVFKIIFMKHSFDWGKTTHGLNVETIEGSA